MSSSDVGDIIPDFVIDDLARCFLPKIQEYFNHPEARLNFEAWQKSEEKSA